MIEKNLKSSFIHPDTDLQTAISRLYETETTICLVVERDKTLKGILTRSDIKKAILAGVDKKRFVRDLMNTEFISAPDTTSLPALKKLAQKENRLGTGSIGQIPLLSKKGIVTGLYISTDVKRSEHKTVLVTGGAGYVGSHVTRILLKRGYHVLVFDKLLFGKSGIEDLLHDKKLTLIEGDIGNVGQVIKAVAEADYVIHLAGIVGDPASALDPIQTMEQNHFATKNLVDISKYYGVSRFIFASSCSVYGSGKSMLTEKSERRPISLYAQSKLYSEKEILKEVDETFHPVILRFGTLFGLSPRMRFDLVANVMTAHALSSKTVTVDGGAQWRPLLHVEDAAAACVASLEAPLRKVSGEIFNVGDTTENYTILDIARMVAKKVKGTQIVELDTVQDRRDYRVSSAKINKAMGWKAKRKLSEGIEEIANAFKKKQFIEWKDARYSNYHTLKNLLEDLST
jgi:nucleoside-diphosphate-sugar epimerase